MFLCAYLLLGFVCIVSASDVDYDVYVLIREDEVPVGLLLGLVEDLEVVDGVQLTVVVPSNDSSGISTARSRLELLLDGFRGYDVVVQFLYNFSTYECEESPKNKSFYLSSFSQTFYDWWYGNVSEVFDGYDDVVLLLGFNEPYWWFSKDDAQVIFEREYTTWKGLSDVPFSLEMTMPYVYWASKYSWPVNPSVAGDLFPYWKDYSDFVGVSLWGYDSPEFKGYEFTEADFDRNYDSVERVLGYCEVLDKPLCISEFPAWDRDVFGWLCERSMAGDNVGVVFQLWAYESWEGDADGWVYALYNVNKDTHAITKVDPNWFVFRDVLNPLPQDVMFVYGMGVGILAVVVCVFTVVVRRVV